MARPTLHDVVPIANVSWALASRAPSAGRAGARMIGKARTAAHQLGYLPDVEVVPSEVSPELIISRSTAPPPAGVMY